MRLKVNYCISYKKRLFSLTGVFYYYSSMIKAQAGNHLTMTSRLSSSNVFERGSFFLKGAVRVKHQIFIFNSVFTSETPTILRHKSRRFPGHRRGTPAEPRVELAKSSPKTSTVCKGKDRLRVKLKEYTHKHIISIAGYIETESRAVKYCMVSHIQKVTVLRVQL